MKAACLCIALLLFSGGQLAAQDSSTYPYKTREYFGPDDRKVAGPEGAHHSIEHVYRDSTAGTIRRYNANGNLQESTQYADIRYLVKLGPRVTFYENGKVQTKDDYVGDERQGEFLVYYPDGALKRRERYVANERTSGECFAPDGSPVAFYPYQVMPSYRGGGTEKLVQAIQAHLVYPSQALMNDTQGRVFVAFVVTATGEIADVKVVKGVSAALDAAAITAVRKVKGLAPGQLDGHAVQVAMTVPITFGIRAAPVNSRSSSPNQRPPFPQRPY